jgi:hypothetical protein
VNFSWRAQVFRFLHALGYLLAGVSTRNSIPNFSYVTKAGAVLVLYTCTLHGRPDASVLVPTSTAAAALGSSLRLSPAADTGSLVLARRSSDHIRRHQAVAEARQGVALGLQLLVALLDPRTVLPLLAQTLPHGVGGDSSGSAGAFMLSVRRSRAVRRLAGVAEVPEPPVAPAALPPLPTVALGPWSVLAAPLRWASAAATCFSPLLMRLFRGLSAEAGAEAAAEDAVAGTGTAWLELEVRRAFVTVAGDTKGTPALTLPPTPSLVSCGLAMLAAAAGLTMV